MLKIILITLFAILYFIGGYIWFDLIHLDYTPEGDATYYLWDKSKDLVLFLYVSYIYSEKHIDTQYFKSWLRGILLGCCVLLFMRAQVGYYIDHEYSVNTGLFFFYFDILLVVVPCFYSIVSYMNYFMKKALE